MNEYDALIGAKPLTSQQTQMLAAKLRGQDDRAILAMLSGDNVLGRVGQMESTNSSQLRSGLAKAKQYELDRAQREADRAAANDRHAETQARLKEQADSNRALSQAYHAQQQRQHEDMMRFREESEANDLLMQGMKIQAAEAKEHAKLTRKQEEDARRLGFKLTDEGITDLESAIEHADEVLGKYFDVNTGERVKGSSNIPGVGFGVNALPDAVAGDDGREVRNRLAAVRNLILKARSGATVTEPEMTRLAQELGLGAGVTEQELIDAYVNLRKRTSTVKSGIYAGFAPEVQDTYDQRFAQRRGLVPSSDQKMQQREQGQRTSTGAIYEVIE